MGRRKAYERDEVLTKAKDCFWRTGYEGTHLSDLVHTTGLNRFSLYKEFEGKDGLFREALLLYAQEAGEHYDRLLARAPLGLENIYNYFANIRIEADYDGCFMVNTLAEKAVIPEDAFEIARDFVHRSESLFAANLDVAVERGELRSDVETSVFAKMLAAFDNGLSVYGIARPNEQDILLASRQFLNSAFGRHQPPT